MIPVAPDLVRARLVGEGTAVHQLRHRKGREMVTRFQNGLVEQGRTAPPLITCHAAPRGAAATA